MDKNLTSLPQIEHDVLAYWNKEQIFSRVVEARQDGEPFVFYDGPPFTTGVPHYGHILQMALKDAVLRYKTMHNFNVPRKIGWDTHGLPIEYELEKELNISGKQEIEAYGIEKFVEAARGIVLRNVNAWKGTMERMGRWVDVSSPYTTMDNNYIESVWWAFAELYNKGLVYEDYRVSPYCPRCGTVLSNFELNQGYKDNVPDKSVYVALEIESEGEFNGASIIFWTTTPWTIPAVTAMSVSKDATYVLFEHEGKRYIMAKDRVADVFADVTFTKEFAGSELLALNYRPLYKLTDDSNAHKIVAGEHVTTTDGTGIASIAPAYGEIDSAVGKQEGLPLVQTIDPDGTVKKGLGIPAEGEFAKTSEDTMIEDLKAKGALVKVQTITHTYPFCWRCDTPLLYYPATSWFINVTKIRQQLVEENKQINWQPNHLRDGRFGRWLEGARDWAVSRNRFWGSPIPVWKCADCNTTKVVGSRAELNLSSDFDLHRPYIDSVTVPCDCGATMQRVPFVLDVWFESGSMPYAQHHYPFENKEAFVPAESKGYPADFIAEALDQTRGWFYTLHVLGVALFGQRAFKNVVVSGLLLAPDGKKLSKRLKNFTDPTIIMEEQGVDALRLFLFTATTIGEDYRFSDAAVQDVKRRWIVPLLNVVNYYHLSAQETDALATTQPEHALLDTWMKARVYEARQAVQEAMEGDDTHSPFDLVRACRTFGPLVEDLSTWYVRLSRGRKDPAFTETLQQILVKISTTFAPFMPFLTEYIYQSVKLPDPKFPASVHLCTLRPLDEWANPESISTMASLHSIVSLGRELRATHNTPLRQPLASLQVISTGALSSEMLKIVGQELQVAHVKQVEAMQEGYVTTAGHELTVGLDLTLTDELKAQGTANGLRRVIQDLRKQAKLTPQDEAVAFVPSVSEAIATVLQEQLGRTQLVTAQPTDLEKLAETVYGDDSEGLTIELYRSPHDTL